MSPQTESESTGIRMLSKVPEITVYFWIIKVMATTVGETGADFLSINLDAGPFVTSIVVVALLVAVMTWQLRATRYVPKIYWLAVVLVSVAGTMLTDGLTDGLDVSLFVSTAVFASALIATFIAWYAKESTLSIHSIFTARREQFYWAAILFTFALGTAAGDLMAEQMHLGYMVSALIFGGMIATVAVAYYAFGANGIGAFWIAYVLTRPLGASFGDLLSQSVPDGGIGLGTITTTSVFLIVILGLVAHLTVTRKDIIDGDAPGEASGD